MDEQNPLDFYDAPAPAPKPKPKKRKIPKKKSVMAPKKKATAAPPAEPEQLTVFLTIRHTINGTPYGPGLVEGPRDLIMALRENEQRNIREEAALTQKPKVAHLMLGGARTLDVHPDFFDDPGSMLSGAPVALSQTFAGFNYTPPKGAQQG